MNKCKKCNVYVYESEKCCPLCYEKMENIKESSVEYPSYKKLIREKSPLKNIPLFVGITATIICVFINIFSHNPGDTIWVIPAGASVLFALSAYQLIRSQFIRYGAKILYLYIFLSAFTIIIDFSTSMLFWSTDFVFPFLTLGVLVYFSILSLQNKSTFSEYFGYMLTVTLIGLITILFYILNFYNYAWGSFVSVVSCVIIVLGLYLFADKSLKDEVKKRFHR